MMAFVLPVVAALLAVTAFWAPARALFRFGALDAQWLVVPMGVGVTVLMVLELLKPIWRQATKTGGSQPTQRAAAV